MRLASWKAAIVPVLVLGGCLCAEGGPGRPTGDGGFDAGIDAGVDAGIDAGLDAGIDAGVDAGPRVPPPEGVFQTSGGGTAEGSSHRMRVFFGAPQPMGTAAGDEHRVVTGPAAGGR